MAILFNMILPNKKESVQLKPKAIRMLLAENGRVLTRDKSNPYLADGVVVIDADTLTEA